MTALSVWSGLTSLVAEAAAAVELAASSSVALVEADPTAMKQQEALK